MASIAKFDTWQNSAGVAYGTVLQVVHFTFTGSSGTSSTTMVASGRYVDITPKFANSKIVVMFSGTDYISAQAGAYQIRRNGTGLSSYHQIGPAGVYTYHPTTMVMVDSPNTTSSVRYELYYYTQSSSGTIYFPPGSADVVYCTAMEIQQ